ncbi:hypothetical protein IQ235_07360 [Oscillatoriales cyanobacterium LEGE 11467]|uniref:Uncharacterized protein n=1 Tax=Zarconia navalis LEGE 11467 TaxID=1828826 RepID=A0A928Z7J5_9CYAN|nr:hypothetical protein [Zarconia navalis]MBE9040600.1 hypothetical protein [Zarconia navalis LEGE 11467]
MIWAKRSIFANTSLANTPINLSISGGAIALSLMLASCSTPSPSPQNSPESTASSASPQASSASADAFATVTDVDVTAGEPGAYTFAVTVQSPDTGCDRYANWWEVLDEEGNLIYRRNLAHSHVEEQPFRRTGGAVAVQPNDVAIVRSHMYPDGYGTQAMQGTVETGFEEISLPAGFAANLAEAEPQPRGCEY